MGCPQDSRRARSGQSRQAGSSSGKPAPARKKLSYKDQRELEQLPARIEQLEADLDAVQTRMSDPDFYKGEPADISAAQTRQSELEQQLEEAFSRWDELDQQG